MPVELSFFFFGSVFLSSNYVTSYLESISVFVFVGMFCTRESGSCSVFCTGLQPLILLP